MKFTFNTGQRPLPDYAIKRGIGRGGFGEVYFALSDGGKEVALKLIKSHPDVEVRGIRECLNLKHSNLVHLYDLRLDGEGNHWVVMEYVAGESLAAHLTRYPDGLPLELACTWFEALAQAVHYLHDKGLVHRDLKPGNIFIESGAVKVGDYGLCKVISGSQQAGQTQSVGTVHYMAPEISTGNYSRPVDVYAAAVILYEMLTGKLPFDGQSKGEILMKHLTAPPDLSKVPSAFVPILDRALSKNPSTRPSMAEMGKEVANILARRAEPLGRNPLAETWTMAPNGALAAPAAASSTALGLVTQLSRSMLLAVLLAAVCTFGWGILLYQGVWQSLSTTFFLATACSWAVLAATQLWKKPSDDSGGMRLVMLGLGAAIGLNALWLDGYQIPLPWVDYAQTDSLRVLATGEPERGHPFFDALYPANRSLPVVVCYLGYFALMFAALRWWRLALPGRPQRFDGAAVLGVAFWAYVLLFLLPTTLPRQEGFLAMVLAAVIVQLVSPWHAPAPTKERRMRLKYA